MNPMLITGAARRAALFCLIAGALVACRGGADWRYYAPMRVIGAERALSPVDPASLDYAAVASKLHYVSLHVDGVFFRNLPGTAGREVALGLSLAGALPKRDIKTVSQPVKPGGENQPLFFDRPFAMDPFLYEGKPLHLTLTFRAIDGAESQNLRGRLQGLGMLGGAAKLAAGALQQLEQHKKNFESFLGGNHKTQLYTYTFTLYPVETEGVRHELVLTGGQHVFVAIPGDGAPAHIRKVKPADLLYKLRLAGSRLEWRHDGREYTDSPYVILSVVRYKRYPSDDLPLRRAAKKLDQFVEDGNWPMARGALPAIGKALLEERALTQTEKNLETAWRDLREAKIEAGEAGGDKARRLKALVRQVQLYGYIGKDFQQILEPHEVKKIAFEARRHARRAEELAAELGSGIAEAKAAGALALASIRPPVEPPANPRLDLEPPKVVTVTVTKPEPFYKKWWFYALVGVAAAGVISGTTAALVAPSTLNEPVIGIPVGSKQGR